MGKAILIVEDDSKNIKLVRDLLNLSESLWPRETNPISS